MRRRRNKVVRARPAFRPFRLALFERPIVDMSRPVIEAAMNRLLHNFSAWARRCMAEGWSPDAQMVEDYYRRTFDPAVDGDRYVNLTPKKPK